MTNLATGKHLVAAKTGSFSAASTLFVAAALVSGILLPFNLEEYSDTVAGMGLPGTLQGYLILAAVLALFLEGDRSKLIAPVWFFLPLLVAIALSVLFSPYSPDIQSLRAVVMSVLMGLLVAWKCQDEITFRWVWMPFVLAAVFASVVCIVQAFSGTNYLIESLHGEYLGKYGLDKKIAFGFTFSSVKFGLMAILTVSLVMSCVLFESASKRARLLLQILLVFPVIAASLLTASRAVWIGVLCVGAVLICMKKFKEGAAVLAAIGGAFLLLGHFSSAPLPSPGTVTAPTDQSDDQVAWSATEKGASAGEGTYSPSHSNTLVKPAEIASRAGDSEPFRLDERASFASGEEIRVRSVEQFVRGDSERAFDLIKNEDSFSLRIRMFGLAKEAFLSSPVTGVGLNRFPDKGRDILVEEGKMGLIYAQEKLSDPVFRVKIVVAELLTAGPRKSGYPVNQWDVPTLTQAVIDRIPEARHLQIGRMLVDPEVAAITRELEGPNTHNMYLSLISELGLVGVVAFVGTALFLILRIVLSYRAGSVAQRNCIVGSVAAACAVLLVALFWHIQFQKEIWVIYGALVGLSVYSWKKCLVHSSLEALSPRFTS